MNGPLGVRSASIFPGDGMKFVASPRHADLLLLTCKQMDERQQLRLKVLRDGDWRERSGLRALDKQIQDALSMLGFTPSDRARLGLAEVKAVSKMEQLRAQRAKVADTGT